MFFFQNLSVINPYNADIFFKFKVSKQSGFKNWVPLFESKSFLVNSAKHKFLIDEAFRDFVDHGAMNGNFQCYKIRWFAVVIYRSDQIILFKGSVRKSVWD